MRGLSLPVYFAMTLGAYEDKEAVRGKLLNCVIDDSENNLDIDLLRQMAGGDRVAFAKFYDRHSPLMFSVAFKVLNNQSDAEDALQEAFVQIWAKASQFDPKLGRAASWGAILARNKAIDRLRGLQRRARLAGEVTAEPAPENSIETANDAAYGHEKARIIRTALCDLPGEQRQAIELAYFSGLTQAEIAGKLNEPLGTIKARIRRGLMKLRDQLGGLL
jgi:RNA polymerase sigma-70 factor, ECF subfamily